MRFEWTPDTMTTISFRPTASYSTNDGRSWSNSASYNDDPYNYGVWDPLSTIGIATLAADSLMVNYRSNRSMNYSDNKRIGGMLQWNRKLNSKGRNLTLRVDANYSSSDSKALSTNNVHLYQVKTQAGADSTYQTNRYNLTPSKNYGYTLQATYSEPLWRATFLQFSYKFNYSFSRSDRSTYDFSNLGEEFFADLMPVYGGWTAYLQRLSTLGNPYTYYYDTDLSRFSEYQNYTHDIEVMFRMIREHFNLSAGILLRPQKSHFKQNYQGHSTDTVRMVTNFTPTLAFVHQQSEPVL